MHAGDADLALFAANAFFGLAGTFFNNLPEEIGAQSAYLQTRKGKLIAATTNLSFAVELFLKGTAIKAVGRAKSGHKLIDLFMDLPPDVRESIEDCYRYRTKHDSGQKFPVVELAVSPYNREMSDDERRAGALNSAAQQDVRSLLKAEQDAFQIWRYFYEQAPPKRPIYVTVNYHRMGVLVNSIQDQFKPRHERPNFQRPV
jgi:HEPN domain-containing protein